MKTRPLHFWRIILDKSIAWASVFLPSSNFWSPHLEDLGFWLAGIVAAVLVGAGKGGIPMIGMLGVPVFALSISPILAAGILLPVYVVSDMFGLWAYRRAFDRRVLWTLVPGAVLGIGLGWATAHVVPEAFVTLLVGLIGVAFAIKSIMGRKEVHEAQQPRFGAGSFWGAATGFTSFVSHSGAPPYQIYVYPLKLEKAIFAGTSTIFFAIVNAVKLIPYYALDQLNPANLTVAAVLAVPAAAAVFGGVAILKVLPEKLFYRLVIWSLLLISGKLIWDGLRGLGWL